MDVGPRDVFYRAARPRPADGGVRAHDVGPQRLRDLSRRDVELADLNRPPVLARTEEIRLAFGRRHPHEPEFVYAIVRSPMVRQRTHAVSISRPSADARRTTARV